MGSGRWRPLPVDIPPSASSPSATRPQAEHGGRRVAASPDRPGAGDGGPARETPVTGALIPEGAVTGAPVPDVAGEPERAVPPPEGAPTGLPPTPGPAP